MAAGAEVVERGGYFIRLGSVISDQSFFESQPGFIDYAKFHRTELTDIYLSAKCRFFLGNSSGTETIPRLFDVPIAVANMIPLMILPYTRRDLYIPKLIWSEDEDRYLTFSELSELGFFKMWGHRTEEYAERGLRPIENSPEDIRGLCREMFDKVEGRMTKYEAAQRDFKERFTSHRPNYQYAGDIAGFFLHKYEYLL